MNIAQAKQEILRTVTAYLAKDEKGAYKIPLIHQRPILLMGPPGIGKSAVIRQAARELQIGLVEYTMTHHTRQSAVGLPILEKRVFQGKEYTVTEYTMSEILACVRDCVERTGISEGILFLDEINCVSETLAPTMLQFLQKKTFGSHPLPEGWVIAAAGNPSRYNKAVREFDVVTLDRVKEMEIAADYPAWKDYAREQGIHPAVLAYLELRKENFYRIQEEREGSSFVTARGWEDFSRMLKAYEELDFPVTEELAGQYLRHEETAREFTGFYRLWEGCRKEWKDGAFWSREGRRALSGRLEKAGFEERLFFLELLVSSLGERVRGWKKEKGYAEGLSLALDRLKGFLEESNSFREAEEALFEERKRIWRILKEQEVFSGDKLALEERITRTLEEWLGAAEPEEKSFPWLSRRVSAEEEKLEELAGQIQRELDESVAFIREACKQELALFLGELCQNRELAGFLAARGSREYLREGERLLKEKKEEELLKEIREFQSQNTASE